MAQRPDIVSLDQLHEAAVVGVDLALADRALVGPDFPEPGPIGIWQEVP